MRAITLETERLFLRPVREEDFDGFCAMMADEEVARFIGGVQTPAMVWRTMCALAGAWSIRGYSMWSVIEKSSGQWIGRLGPWYPHGWPAPEIGWGLVRSAQGRGYASEGASAAMDFAFDILGWNHAIHCIDAANAPSIKLAERLGSRPEGTARAPEPIKDVVWQLYGQSAEDWRARRINKT
jgi:RimJ/RimL family protein N-acetyltransferase